MKYAQYPFADLKPGQAFSCPWGEGETLRKAARLYNRKARRHVRVDARFGRPARWVVRLQDEAQPINATATEAGAELAERMTR